MYFLLLVHFLIVFILEFWMDLRPALLMMDPHDARHVAHLMLLAEEKSTHIAAVGLLLIVDELVAFQVVAGGKGPFTAVAGIRPGACMNALVLCVMAATAEVLAAELAGKRAIAVVELHVFVQPSQREGADAANAAGVLVVVLKQLCHTVWLHDFDFCFVMHLVHRFNI